MYHILILIDLRLIVIYLILILMIYSLFLMMYPYHLLYLHLQHHLHHFLLILLHRQRGYHNLRLILHNLSEKKSIIKNKKKKIDILYQHQPIYMFYHSDQNKNLKKTIVFIREMIHRHGFINHFTSITHFTLLFAPLTTNTPT
jgi:hypothetical protein